MKIYAAVLLTGYYVPVKYDLREREVYPHGTGYPELEAERRPAVRNNVGVTHKCRLPFTSSRDTKVLILFREVAKKSFFSRPATKRGRGVRAWPLEKKLLF